MAVKALRQLLLSAALLLPLGLDTFAIAAALGVAGLRPEERLRVALVFTAFEAGMPVLGLLAGHAVGALVGAWSGYLAAAVLAATGAYMLRPGQDDEAEERQVSLLAHARGAAILGLGISVSLDELTIGISAGLLGLSIVLIVVWVAVQAFVAAQVGMRFGTRIGDVIRERAERLAGVALIALAAVLVVLQLLKV